MAPYASSQEFSPLIVHQATYLTEPTCPEPSMVLAPHLCSFSLMSFWNRIKEAHMQSPLKPGPTHSLETMQKHTQLDHQGWRVLFFFVLFFSPGDPQFLVIIVANLW